MDLNPNDDAHLGGKVFERAAGRTSPPNHQPRDALACRSNGDPLEVWALFEHAPDACYLMDLSGHFVQGNRAAEKLIGWNRDEVIGKSFLESGMLEFDQAEVALAMLLRVGAGESLGPVSLRLNHRDGHRLDVELASHRVSIGGQFYALGCVRDITDRKSAEQALAKSEATLRLAQRIGRMGSWELNLATGELAWSAETYRIFGIQPSLFRPSREAFYNLVHPEDRARVREAAQTAIRTRQPYRIEHRIVLPDDSERYVLDQADFEVDEQGQVQRLVGIVQDITEQRRTADALKQSEERFQQLAKNIDCVFWMATPAIDQLIYVSPAYQLIWGRTSESLYANPKSFLDAIHPADRERFAQSVGSGALGRTGATEIEYRIVRPDGAVRWIRDRGFPVRDEGGQVQFVVGIADDITQRKTLQAEIARRERQLTSFFRGATAGLALLDRDLRFLQVNETLAEINGAPVRDHLGQSLSEMLPKLAPVLQPILREVLLTGKPALDVEITGETRRRPGVQRYWNGSYFPISGAGGAPEGVGVIVVETTEHRDLEAQLRHAQKMEGIGRLAGGVAHDFNNLLAVIQMSAELLLNLQPSLEFQEGLRQIQITSDRAARLTRQLLAFSRKQVMQMRALDLNEVIGEMSKMLKRIIGEHVRFGCALSGTPLFVQADPGMIEQILVNLVVNARDAMPNGGQLQIGTEQVVFDEQTALAQPERRAGSFARFKVTDTGTGIVPEHLQRIFEPFFTTKEPGKGTGLGLATVYGIAKQHRGWVEASSQVGVGTTFEVFLPCAEAPAKMSSPEAEAPLQGGDEGILLVEDNGPVRTLTRRLLESFGYRVYVAGNGQEALDLWKLHRPEIRLLLTDIVLPGGLGGRELAEHLRRQESALGVVFMSGYASHLVTEERTGLVAGRNRFIQKPCSLREMLQTVRDCLDSK
jgi:two-component system cell cycle sensor histidine kinase/response regulator CckA